MELPNELSARIMFSELVKRMEKMSTTKHMEEKKTIAGKFFKSILELQKKFQNEEGPEANASFYPFLRLFLPKYDLERGAFEMQTKTLGRLFVSALAINSKSSDAIKLTNLQGNTTNYGDIVYDVMRCRSPEKGSLTVYEINKYLDLICEHVKNNQRKKIDDEIVNMLNRMSALDRKWLTRILLKRLHLGVGEKFMLELYHKKASELYNKCSHLSRVCELIESNIPSDQLESGIVEIFKPIRSMLCERGSISEINQMLSRHDYYLETKMDGERCQLHMQDKQFKYFSRSCKEDLTRIFGESSTTGLYSQFLHQQLGGKVKSAIFDGEMMVWDRESEIFLKKAENYTAKFLKSTDERRNPCFCIYDLLYFDGESMIDKPYAERIRKLQTIIKEQRGSLMLCHRTKIRDAAHFLECLNSAFDSNEEGVVIKQDDSKYHPGKRDKGGWFKIKPDYENNLISDFDLLIIGGFYNDKRTSVDSFLLALMGTKGEEGTNSDVFHAVCRIRNGFKRSQFAEILSRLEPHKREVNKSSRSPPGIEWARAIPDFWYDPKNSIVLQIKASELTETGTYRTTHTFRFPRVMEIRWDKTYRDICSLYEFKKFCSSDAKLEKLTKRHATSNDLFGVTVNKRRQTTKMSINIPSTSTTFDIVPVDNLCEGLDFCIINCDKKAHTVKELEAMVKRHGGKVVSYPNSKTYVVIAGNPKTLNVQRLIKAKCYNIATPQWLVRALGSEKPITQLTKFTLDDMVFATTALQERFDAETNDYGDRNLEPDDSQKTECTDGGDEMAQIISQNDEDGRDIFYKEPEAREREEENVRNVEIVPSIEPNETSIYDEDTEMIDEENMDATLNAFSASNNTEPTIEPEPIQPQGSKADEQEIKEHTCNEIVGIAENPSELNKMEWFSSCVAYFYQENAMSMDCDLTFAQCMLIGKGGTCLETPDDIQASAVSLTHIFVANDEFNRDKLREFFKTLGKQSLDNIQIMRYQWILDCDEQNTKLSDSDYLIQL